MKISRKEIRNRISQEIKRMGVICVEYKFYEHSSHIATNGIKDTLKMVKAYLPKGCMCQVNDQCQDVLIIISKHKLDRKQLNRVSDLYFLQHENDLKGGGYEDLIKLRIIKEQEISEILR